jgi:hypothetical protein
MTRLAALLLVLVALPAAAQDARHCVVDIRGNQVCGIRPDQCVLDRYRAAWCAPANGVAMKDRYDEVVCGAGACFKDVHGEILCAAEAGGALSNDVSGRTSCAGGCVPATRSACRRMTPD